MHSVLRIAVISVTATLAACGPTDSDIHEGWAGTIDTLTSGEIMVRNTDRPIWTPEQNWQIVEQLRIGSSDEEGPELFGSIASLDVDSQGRVYVLDDQATEIRVFDAQGNFVRTVGNPGRGPGEFTCPEAIDISPNGEIWVMEMSQGRLSMFDENGQFLRTERTSTEGWMISPYPGGFDPVGRYNLLNRSSTGDGNIFVRFDQNYTPIDTIPMPQDSNEDNFFELRQGGMTMRTSIPFTGSLDWDYCPSGNVWTLQTDSYELVELKNGGEVLRRVTKEYESIPVTTEDQEQIREDYAPFTRRGGKIDWSRIPRTKPVTVSLFCDASNNVWVKRIASKDEDEDRIFDVFDSDGRFLGNVQFPFPLRSDPVQIERNGLLYGLTADEDDVMYVVAAQIVK